MSDREKLLGGVVGAAIIGVMLYQGVNRLAIQPRLRLCAEISDKQDDVRQLEAQLARGERLADMWKQRTALTLSSDIEDAQIFLHEHLYNLLKQAGFNDPMVGRPSAIGHRVYGRYKGVDFKEVTVQMHVQGQMRNLMTFLRDFYQLPYYADLSQMVVNVKKTKTRKIGRGEERAEEPTLDVTMTATALVLPRMKDVPSAEYDPNGPKLDPRLLYPDELSAYDALVSANVFKKWVKPVPPPPVRPVETPDEREDDEPIVTPQRDPLPDKTLVKVEAVNGHYFAAVRDNGRLDLPPEEIALNGRIEDGVIVFVDRDGVVMRVQGPDETGVRVTTEYFWPLGGSLRDRVELDPNEHSDIYEALHQTQG
ncbi:MAG: hypothetical protein JXO22_13115 [Phycisphaerae bacterium]|nr:hypothetical protein [Phycisphaerae bacterium]